MSDYSHWSAPPSLVFLVNTYLETMNRERESDREYRELLRIFNFFNDDLERLLEEYERYQTESVWSDLQHRLQTLEETAELMKWFQLENEKMKRRESVIVRLKAIMYPAGTEEQPI
jgi:DnaJ-domain-containing protein 1